MEDERSAIAGLRSVGALSPVPPNAFDLPVDELRSLIGKVSPAVREIAAAYLRSASLVFPLMEYTQDIIENSFGVAGGASIMSDGTYYWRLDAAEYVAQYGIAVDQEALIHMAKNRWTPPSLGPDLESRIEDALDAVFGFQPISMDAASGPETSPSNHVD